MIDKEHIEALRSEAQKLDQLLAQPEFGLFSWVESLDHQLDAIYLAARKIRWTPPEEFYP